MSTMVDNSRWDQRYQNQQGPITSGFVSNSDIRQKEKQEQIRSERQREYQDIMNKHEPPVYYKTGGVSELSLPIGNYEESRRVLDDQRQREYNIYITQKKDAENKRREDLYLNARQNYKAPPEPDMYDHSQISKDLREERQNEYNDYLREKENMQSRRRVPPTPPGGLNIATEQERKRVEDLKKSQYRDELLKQQNEQLYNRAQQQGEIPVLNRSSPTQAPPNQISPRGRPPPHPDSIRQRGQPPQDDRMCQNHMEQSRQTPNFWDEGRQAPSPKSVEDELATSNKSHVVDSQNKSRENDRRPQEEIRTGFFDDRRRTPPNRDERQQDYQNYLADNQRKDEMRRQKLDEMRQAPQPGVSKGTYYNSDTYEQKRQSLNSQRREEYQNFLSKQNPGSSRSKKESSTLTSLPLYQNKYDAHYKTLKQMRNEEYNQLLDETNRPSYRQYTPENMQGLPINQNRYDQAKRIQEQQRNREYNEHLAKKGEKMTSEDEMLAKRDVTLKKYMDQQLKSEMHDKKSPDQRERRQWNDHSDPKGIIAGVDSYNYEKRKVFADERKQEYKDIMEKKYGHQQPKRVPEQPPANSIGFMANLGFHEQERDKLNKEKRDEYNKFLDERSQLARLNMMRKIEDSTWEKAYGKDGMPRGRPNWVDGKDSWYNQEPPPFNKTPGPARDQEPPRERPGSFNRRPSPSYQEILDSKRKQEASYRRFDDPEYSRSGAPQGGPGPDYSRAPGGPNDGYMGRYD